MISIIKSFLQAIQSRVPWLAVVAVFAMLRRYTYTACWLGQNKRLSKSEGQCSRHLKGECEMMMQRMKEIQLLLAKAETAYDNCI